MGIYQINSGMGHGTWGFVKLIVAWDMGYGDLSNSRGHKVVVGPGQMPEGKANPLRPFKDHIPLKNGTQRE